MGSMMSNPVMGGMIGGGLGGALGGGIGAAIDPSGMGAGLLGGLGGMAGGMLGSQMGGSSGGSMMGGMGGFGLDASSMGFMAMMGQQIQMQNLAGLLNTQQMMGQSWLTGNMMMGGGVGLGQLGMSSPLGGLLPMGMMGGMGGMMGGMMGMGAGMLLGGAMSGCCKHRPQCCDSQNQDYLRSANDPKWYQYARRSSPEGRAA